MTANLHRGDVEVLLRGAPGVGGGRRPYLLRPSYGGLAVMEAMSGEGIFALARRFAAGNTGFTHTTAVIAGGLEGGSAGGLRSLLGDGPRHDVGGTGGGAGARDSPHDSPHDSPVAGGRGWAWERVAELVFETGFLSLVAPASELLWQAVKGDEELAAEGEAKAGNG